MSKFDPGTTPKGKRTFAAQDKLPKLPIPPLEATCRRYLEALKALQNEHEHELTTAAVEEFLEKDGPNIQEVLVKWAESRDSLGLNPFFVLEPRRTAPKSSGAHCIFLGFIHDLRAEILEPDNIRGIPLDMDQYTRLFGTARIPTERGCKMHANPESRHIVVLRRGQFYWFDVLDDENRPVLTEREVIRNLQAIVIDADKTHRSEVSRSAIGVLSTENRKEWSRLRATLSTDHNNAPCLEIVDNALFIVCLDDAAPGDLAELCANFLCGTYELDGGVQIGTCTNRWYDKLQIIVCADGAAGINFEHTGVDGHTVLRPDSLPRLAIPHARAYKVRGGKNGAGSPPLGAPPIDTTPKKLEWKLSAELRVGIRFAETRLSDLICQNDCQAL
ncbi:hypothetical protein B0H14DRAFT_3698769, partial [Mycena olivaceomarginata]